MIQESNRIDLDYNCADPECFCNDSDKEYDNDLLIKKIMVNKELRERYTVKGYDRRGKVTGSTLMINLNEYHMILNSVEDT